MTPTPDLAAIADQVRRGAFAEAEAACRAFLRHEPDHPGGQYLLSVVLLQRSAFDEALQQARRCLATARAHAGASLVAARALRALGRVPEAVVAAAQALGSAPDHRDLDLLLGSLLVDLDAPKAEDHLTRLVARHADDPEGWTELGRFLLKAERWQEAHGAFAKALLLAPQSALARLGEARSLDGLGQTEAALRSFGLAEQLDPAAVGPSYHLGRCLAEAGDLAAARDALQRAVAKQPEAADAWFTLGLVLQDLLDHPAAAAAFDRAVGLRPDWVPAIANRGVSLQESGDLPGALRSYRRAYGLDADSIGIIVQALAAARTGKIWLDPVAMKTDLAACDTKKPER